MFECQWTLKLNTLVRVAVGEDGGHLGGSPFSPFTGRGG